LLSQENGVADCGGPGTPTLVRVDVWRVPRGALLGGFWRAGTDARRLQRIPGLRFARLLGTAEAGHMSPRHATLDRWLLITAWGAQNGPAEGAPAWDRVQAAWRHLATEHGHLRLRPTSARGLWSGREPFGCPTPGAETARVCGPVAVVTRARVRAAKIPAFLRAAPPVARALATAEGLRYAVGFGEAPIGWQGTLSVWRDTTAMERFAHDDGRHTAVVRRTPLENWYAEQLFARFRVLGGSGTLDGRPAAALCGPGAGG
jgi:hypothetical protein